MVASVFVDHWINFSYVILQKNSSSNEYLNQNRFRLIYSNKKHYHTVKCKLVYFAFKFDLQLDMQWIGMNSYQQNDRARKLYQRFTGKSRVLLLYAIQKWPDAISHYLRNMNITSMTQRWIDTSNKLHKWIHMGPS